MLAASDALPARGVSGAVAEGDAATAWADGRCVSAGVRSSAVPGGGLGSRLDVATGWERGVLPEANGCASCGCLMGSKLGERSVAAGV